MNILDQLKTKTYIIENIHRQCFSFPRDVISYAFKSRSSAVGYQKLLTSCKYFLSKNQYFLLPWLSLSRNYHSVKVGFNFDKVSRKIWLVGQLYLTENYNINQILEKVSFISLFRLNIRDQNLLFNELNMLTASKTVKEFFFKYSIVEDGNGKIVPFENIIELFPNVKDIHCNISTDIESFYTQDTAANIVNLPNFKKLQFFNISFLPSNFNFTHFCDFINSNGKTYLCSFNFDVSSGDRDAFEANLKTRYPNIYRSSYHSITILK